MQERNADLERAIEKGERVLLPGRRIMQPVEQHAEVEDPEAVRREPRDRCPLVRRHRLGHELADERDVARAKVDGGATEAELRRWPQRVDERGADESLVRLQEFDLALD